MPIDTVCGMELSITEITLVLNGTSFYFCSEGCRAEFLRHTDDYVQAATTEVEAAEPLGPDDV